MENAVKRIVKACDKLKISGDVIYENQVYVSPDAQNMG